MSGEPESEQPNQKDLTIEPSDRETQKTTNSDETTEDLKLVQKLKDLLGEVTTKSEKAKLAILSKEAEIIELCSRLTLKIDAKSEMFIEEIRSWSQTLRSEVIEYQNKCLEKFDADKFEEAASSMKPLINEMESLQESINQQIDHDNLDHQKIEKLVEDINSTLREFNKQNSAIKKQKFSDTLLFFGARNAKLDLHQMARLFRFKTNWLDHLRLVTTFETTLSYCFINPFASPREIIALLYDTPDQLTFIKMDTDGKIIMKKEATSSFKFKSLQSLEYGFIMQMDDDNRHFKRYDYDFNEIGDYKCALYLYDGFAANRDYVICSAVNPKYYTISISFFGHDLNADQCFSLPTGCQVDRISKMLANEKYLYIWYRNGLRVIDTKAQKVVNDIDFGKMRNCYVKFLGNEYIAVFNQKKQRVNLYTQDHKVELVKVYQVSIGGDCSMANDFSDEFCFFDSEGNVFID